MAGPIILTHLEEWEKVWRWRFRELKRMGYDHVDAEVLAESDVDLHELEDLLNAGCPHDLAAQIRT